MHYNIRKGAYASRSTVDGTHIQHKARRPASMTRLFPGWFQSLVLLPRFVPLVLLAGLARGDVERHDNPRCRRRPHAVGRAGAQPGSDLDLEAGEPADEGTLALAREAAPHRRRPAPWRSVEATGWRRGGRWPRRCR